MTTQETRLALAAELKHLNLSYAAAAQQIGISAAWLSNFINEKTQGDISRNLKKLQNWLRENKLRSQYAAIAAPKYAETKTAQAIVTTLRYAQNLSDCAVIYGGAGLGKTTAARHYQSQATNVFLVTATPANSSMVETLKSVCDATGLRSYPKRASELERVLIDHLKGRKALLVIDEAQHLHRNALEELRAIQEAAQLGLVLMGNDTVYTRLTGGSRAIEFAQLFSRIGKRLKLTEPRTDDLAIFLDAWQIQDKQVCSRLTEIAQQPGALRLVTKILTAAQVVLAGRDDSQQLDRALVDTLWRDLAIEI